MQPALLNRYCMLALWLCMIVAFLNPSLNYAQSSSQLAPADIRYEVQPVLERGDLKKMRITLRFTGERDGSTTVFLPNEYAGQSELWRQIGAPSVSGGTVTAPKTDRWSIQHSPRARITITYELITAFDNEPDMNAVMSKPFRPMVRPSWFSLVGSTTFARLNVDDQTPVRFQWRRVPRGWTVASDLDHPVLTAGDLGASSLIGGKDLNILGLGTGGTRIAMRGNFRNFTAEQLQADFTQLNGVHRALWGDNDRPFFISLAPVTDNSGSSFLLGTGLGDDAFGAWVLETTSRAEIMWLFAHEHLHAWIPSQVGKLDSTKSEILSYWFSEGFTNYYTARTLLRAGFWTPEDWVKHWNEVISEYQNSPARLMPAADTVDKFWSDATVRELPYQRGALIALTIDQRIKEATNQSKSLDDVMGLMRQKAQTGGKFAPELLIESVKEIAGFDITDLIKDVAINGQAIGFPSVAWGSCMTKQEDVRPVFDVGFDRERTGAAGNVATGVRGDGPAYQAGLRDGMKILRRTTGKLGDQSAPVTYEIETVSGKIETLSWLPTGPPINVQTLSLGTDFASNAGTDKRAKCVSLLSGG
jgi:predicted metalloprotease with PDZ domain